MFYAELKTHTGRWTPTKFYEVPNVKDGRLNRISGHPPAIRPMGTDANGKPVFHKVIHRDHGHLTLDQLREVYSPDGKFQATQRPVASVDVDGSCTVKLGATDYMDLMSGGPF